MRNERLAIIGVGSELRGDDAAGVRIVRDLQALRLPQKGWLQCNAGVAPENTTGLLRRFQPQTVLLIDTVQMNALPGTVRLVDWRETCGSNFSTHTLPLNLFAEYLTLDLGCEVLLLGIQPQQLTLDAPISPVVYASIEQIVQTLRTVLER